MKRINNFKKLLNFFGKKNFYIFNQRLQKFQFKADQYAKKNLIIKDENEIFAIEQEEKNKNLVKFKNKKDFNLFLTSMENSQILLKNILANKNLLNLDLLFLTIKQLKNNFENFPRILAEKKKLDSENKKLNKNYEHDILMPFSTFSENWVYLEFLELTEKMILQKIENNFEKCSFTILLLFDFDFRYPSKNLINKWLETGLFNFSENNQIENYSKNDFNLEGQEWILKLSNKLIVNRKNDFEDFKKLEEFFSSFNDYIYENFDKFKANQKIIFLLNFENARKIVNFKNFLFQKIDYDCLIHISNLQINTLFKLMKIFEENNNNNFSEIIINKINNKIQENKDELKIDNIFQITEIFEKKEYYFLQNIIIENFHRFVYLDNYESDNRNPPNILYILNFYLKECTKKKFLSESLIEYVSENFLLLNSDFYDFENFIDVYYCLTLNNFYSEKFLDENFVYYIKDLFQKKIMLLEDKNNLEKNLEDKNKNHYLFLYLDLLWSFLTNNYSFLKKNDFINNDVNELLKNLKKENWNLLEYDYLQQEKMKQINFYLSIMGIDQFFDVENNIIFEKNKIPIFNQILEKKLSIIKNISKEKEDFYLLLNDKKIPIFILNEEYYYKTIENYIETSISLKMNNIGKTKLEMIKKEHKNYLIITIEDYIQNNYELYTMILKDDHFLKKNDFDIIIDKIQNDSVFTKLVDNLKKKYFDIEKKFEEAISEEEEDYKKIPEIEDDYPVSDDEDYR